CAPCRGVPSLRHSGQWQLRAGIRSRRPRCLRANGGLDRSQPPRVRNLSHPDPVSWYTAVPSAGAGGTHPASELGSLRHRPRGVPAEANEHRGAGPRVRVVLRHAILASLHLEAPPQRFEGRTGISGHELPLQALEPLLAPADTPSFDGGGMETAHRAVTAPASEIAPATRDHGRSRTPGKPLRQWGSLMLPTLAQIESIEPVVHSMLVAASFTLPKLPRTTMPGRL